MDVKAPPMERNGTASISVIHGVRYKVQEFKGDSMAKASERVCGAEGVARGSTGWA